MMRTIGIVVGLALLLLVVAALGFWLWHRAPDIPFETLETRYATPASRYADLGDGQRIHYLDTGPAGAPPIVLIHGFGDNAFSWDGWTRVLAPGHRVLAVDLPGHGLTRTPAGFVLAPDAIADTIDRWMARIGVAHAAVAGNSLGGAVAWRLAARHPQQVDRLILVDAAGFPNPPSDATPPLAFRLMRYKLGRDLITSIDNTPLIREGLRKDVVDPAAITDPFVARWAALQRAPGHRPILMSLAPGGGTPDAALATIRAPTLILWGEADPIVVPASAERFHRAIPGSRLLTYPRVGHLPQVEAPDRTARDVAAFLDGRPAG